MASRRTFFLVLLGLALLAAVVFLMRFGNRQSFDWSDTWGRDVYRETNDQPYGTLVLHRLLESYFPGRRLVDVKKSLSKEMPLDTGANYVFVGEAMFLDSLDTQHLLHFVEAGNTALIISKTVPFDLMFYLLPEECPDTEWSDYEIRGDTFVALQLNRPETAAVDSFFYAIQNKPSEYQWHYIPDSHFCKYLPHRPLGRLDKEYINFAEFPLGKGRFLLHTTPLAFSNFSLLRPQVRPYAEAVLSCLPEGDIYWDAFSRVPEAVGRRRNGMSDDRGLPDKHPLTYILEQPALAWAWYLLLGLAFVYIVFRAKRRQRIVPVLPKNENSSYEFISTIANLHFRERNYRGLCLQSMKLFLAQIRERYGMVAALDAQTDLPRLDHDYIQRLSRLSEVPAADITTIFTQYTSCVQYQPTEEMMVDLHLAIESFFKRAK